MDKNDKIYVAGHLGMVGSAIIRQLEKQGFMNIVARTLDEMDLTDVSAVAEFFKTEKPDCVILAAAKVGGIHANMHHQAEFIYENLMIQTNVIHQSYLNGVKKLCFLGSSCIYPTKCKQPMKEEYLLSGALEPTNEGYAIAKIAGLKMTEYYNRQYGFNSISVMPCNLYGTNDNFDLENSHVLSAMVRRFVDAVDDGADSVTLWGTGIARREFLHVDDAAAGIVFLMNNYDEPEFVNLGWGTEVTIKKLAEMISSAAGFKGELAWDSSKPDGMLLKCMDSSKLNKLGFTPQITLEEGVARTIAEYKQLKACL
ncbi:MAG: GDP-L-fucose synthase [Planctomycetes bacterium]|nr:GDP-L-fucose synthase [Planctomycetota bacterium]